MQVEKELTNVSAETLDMIRQWLKSGADFVQQQAPDVCQQLIQREVYISWAGIGMGVALLLVAALLILAFIKYMDEDNAGFFGVSSLLCFAVGLGVTAMNTYYLICVYAAPKVFVLEALLNMAKTQK